MAPTKGREAISRREYFPLRILRLERTAAEEDVKRHFLRVDQHCQPRVSPLVPDFEARFQSTTVLVFVEQNDTQRESKIKLFKKAPFTDRHGTVSEPILSEDWRGVTVLAQTDEEPLLDIFFVHGLDGNAFNTFYFRPECGQPGCMWAQDLLPKFLKGYGYSARFLTYGYNASLAKEQGEEVTIVEEAETLLNNVAKNRPEGSTRPIIFVCHSLGGLVICQAVLETLESGAERHIPANLKAVFTSCENKSVIKGIVFFGTPFKGSILADYLAPAEPMLSSRLQRLKRKDEQRDRMLKRFEELRSQLEKAMEILIFYEKKPVKKFFFQHMVTDRDAALGYFTNNVLRHPIDRDHRQMCRFPDQSDKEYSENVAPMIRGLIQRNIDASQPGEPSSADNELQNLEGRPLDSGHGEGNLLRERTVDLDLPSRPVAPSTDDESFQAVDDQDTSQSLPDVDRIVSTLKLVDCSSIFRPERRALPGTCDWMLQKDLFQKWLGDESDSILFIRGGQGQGKSVLSSFIDEHLKTTQQEDVFVVRFTCNIAGRDGSPTLLLQHVLQRLCQKFHAQLSRFADKQNQLLGFDPTYETYWQLFRRLCAEASFRLFYIIDGLDQSVDDGKQKEDHHTNSTLRKFLDDLCETFNGSSDQHKSRTKFFVTTRPLKEISLVKEKFDIPVLDMEDSDVRPGVEKMVENDVKKLVREKRLSTDIEDMIVSQLKSKAGAMYQWTHSTLQYVRGFTFHMNAFQEYEDRLERFRPGDIDNPYCESLRDIQNDPWITESDKRMIASLLRIVASAEEDLSVDDLRYALAMDEAQDDATPLDERLPAALLDRIQGSCRTFFVVEKSLVKFGHQSVRDFLLSRVPEEVSAFNCGDAHRNHEYMTRLCLRYMRTVFNDDDLVQTLGNMPKDGVDSRFTMPFMRYAAFYWMDHARKLSHLDRIWGSLYKSLTDDSFFQFMQRARIHHLGTVDPPVKVRSLGIFLAFADLAEVLSRFDFYRTSQSARHTSPFALRKISGQANHINVEEKDVNHDWTMLHYAAMHNSCGLAELLLHHGAPGDACTDKGETPFYVALRLGMQEVAMCLRDHGLAYLKPVSINTYTPLQLAAYRGMVPILEHLLDEGADVDELLDELGVTPLYVAMDSQRLEVVKTLLRRGADPSLSHWQSGRAALHFAAGRGDLLSARAIVKARPDVDVGAQDNFGCQPIHLAANNGHYEAFKYFLARTQSVKQDYDGWLPSHFAAFRGHTSILRCCSIEHLSISTHHGRSPLHFAASGGHTETVQYLLDQSVDVNLMCKNLPIRKHISADAEDGETALMFALGRSHLTIVDMLIKQGASLKDISSDGKTPLHCATMRGHQELVQLLLERGLDPFHEDKSGNNVMHIAAIHHQDELLQLFLDRLGKDKRFAIDHPNHTGMTPLLIAARNGHDSTMEMLLKAGANPHHVSPIFGGLVIFACSAYDHGFLQRLIDMNLSVDRNIPGRYGDTTMHTLAEMNNVRGIIFLAGLGDEVDKKSVIDEGPLFETINPQRTEAFETLIALGANPCQRDARGLCVLEYVNEGHGFWESVQALGLSHVAMEETERKELVKSNLQRFLQYLSNIEALDANHQWLDYFMIARITLHLQDDDATTILAETLLTRLQDGSVASRRPCSACEKSQIQRPLYLCRRCHLRNICSACYEKRLDGDGAKFCPATHEYLPYGGDEWWELPEGQVNEAGQSIEVWFESFKHRYA